MEQQPKKPTTSAAVDDFEGTPAYQCSLCSGVAFLAGSKLSVKTLSLFASNGPNVVSIQDVPRTIVHRCPHGGAGIASIIGIVPDDILAKATGQTDEEGSLVN